MVDNTCLRKGWVFVLRHVMLVVERVNPDLDMVMYVRMHACHKKRSGSGRAMGPVYHVQIMCVCVCDYPYILDLYLYLYLYMYVCVYIYIYVC